MKKSLCPIGILTLVLLLSCATDQKAVHPTIPQEKCDAPAYNEGDTWRFVGSGGEQWEERIIRKDNKLEVRQTPQKYFHAFRGIPFEGARLFPLWVGKKFQGNQTVSNVEGIPLNYFYSIKVLDIVDVKVEARNFRCYRIEFKTSYSSNEGVGYYYYSPETKSIIKFETRSSMLYKWGNYELLSFSVK